MKLLHIAALAFCLNISAAHAFDDCQQSMIRTTVGTSIASTLFGYGLSTIVNLDDPVTTRIGKAVALGAMATVVVGCMTYVTVHFDCPAQPTIFNP
jgi:hypothetical protein